MARNGRSERNIRSASCLCCGHPERTRLELLRVSGVSLDALAREFKISRDSVFRHFKNHVSERRRAELLAGPARVHDLANAAAAESKSLLDYLGITRGVLFNRRSPSLRARGFCAAAHPRPLAAIEYCVARSGFAGRTCRLRRRGDPQGARQYPSFPRGPDPGRR